MRAEGLEPPNLAAPAPKAGVSANSTTPAREGLSSYGGQAFGHASRTYVRTAFGRILRGSVYNDAPRGDWSNGEDGGLQNRKSGFDSLVPRW